MPSTLARQLYWYIVIRLVAVVAALLPYGLLLIAPSAPVAPEETAAVQGLNPGQNPGAQAVECLLPSNIPAIDIRLEKGSVVFFHSELAHASHANRSKRFRHSFLATYIRAGSPFRPGGAQQRREVSLN